MVQGASVRGAKVPPNVVLVHVLVALVLVTSVIVDLTALVPKTAVPPARNRNLCCQGLSSG